MDTKGLLLQQLNKKMGSFSILKDIVVPPTGWIRAIRKALGITQQQLGTKLSITKQSVMEMERREQEGSITIRSMREVAEALDMQFVYGFVPKDGSLDALIDRKATELAKKIVMRTSHTMKLEDQENSRQRLEQAIQERAQEIKQEMPKMLWD